MTIGFEKTSETAMARSFASIFGISSDVLRNRVIEKSKQDINNDINYQYNPDSGKYIKDKYLEKTRNR